MTTSIDMPKYRSIKIVGASQIKEIGNGVIALDSAEILLSDLPLDIFNRGAPSPGDYLIRYEGDYWSWSPKDVFEKGYVALEDGRTPTGVDFELAASYLVADRAMPVADRETCARVAAWLREGG